MSLSHAQHQTGSVTVDTATPNTHPPRCHVGGTLPVASGASHAGFHNPAARTSAATMHDNACCNTAACQSACAHPCATDVNAIVVVAPQRPTPDRSRPLDLSHRAPALPNLIRPPIG